MLINPAVIALLAGSLMVTAFTLYASGVGLRILLRWDRDSAAETQLRLENQTYLVSAILNHVLVIELLSLFLFIAVANQLHTFFTGAMCAVGVLNVNPYGYLTLALKTASFLAGGVWLVVNHVDNLGSDYPLIRFKYLLLLGLCLLVVAGAVLQFCFLLGLDPQIITSCCGALFDNGTIAAAALTAPLSMRVAAVDFYVAAGLTLAAGAWFAGTGRQGWLYGLLSAALLPLALLALVSFFCLYLYELPTHHCPFCLLQGEYRFAGYFLYAFLLVGAVAGASTGIVDRFRAKASLAAAIPGIQKRLCGVSMLGYGLFTLQVTYPVVFSRFTPTGF